MEAIAIRKTSGELVPFDATRIIRSVIRAGATQAQADEVLLEVRRSLRYGMTTQEVYALVNVALERRNRCVACRYGLRDALLRLGPSGFAFEQYIAALWAAQGYVTELPDELEGGCVMHEVDVLARKDGKTFAVEAKFRNKAKDLVQLKDVMASYARYLDLLDGAALHRCEYIHEFWIVTNSAFSERGERFGRCKGMRLIGWNYPENQGLARMIDRYEFYPITIVKELTQAEFVDFAKANVLLCQDILREEASVLARRTGLAQGRIEELIDLAAVVVARQTEQQPQVMTA